MKLIGSKKTFFSIFLIGILFISLPLMSQRKAGKYFPDFASQSKNIGKIFIYGDILHLKDIKGKIDVFDLSKNKKLWGIFIEAVKKKMKVKRYDVDKDFLTSMGLYLDGSEKEMYLRLTEEQKKIKNDKLPLGKAPYFVDEKVENDPELKIALVAAHKVLFEYKRKKGDTNITIPEAMAMAKGTGCDTLFIITLMGRTLTFGRMLAGGMVGGLIGDAILGSKGVFFNLYIIDVKSGELIWAQKYHKTGSNYSRINKTVMKKVAKILTRELPYRAFKPEVEKTDKNIPK